MKRRAAILGIVFGVLSLFAVANPPFGFTAIGTYTTPSHSGAISFISNAWPEQGTYKGAFTIDTTNSFPGVLKRTPGATVMAWSGGPAQSGTAFLLAQTNGTYSGTILFGTGSRTYEKGTASVNIYLPL